MKLFVVLLLMAFSYSVEAKEGRQSKLKDFVDRSGYKVREAPACKIWVASDDLTIPRSADLQGLLLIAREGDTGTVGGVTPSTDLLTTLLPLNHEIQCTKMASTTTEICFYGPSSG